MSLVYFITHPDVVIDPDIPLPWWPLSVRDKEWIKKSAWETIFGMVIVVIGKSWFLDRMEN